MKIFVNGLSEVEALSKLQDSLPGRLREMIAVPGSEMSLAEAKAALAEYGHIVMDDQAIAAEALSEAQGLRISYIEKEFVAAKLAGCDTSQGYKMVCNFEDANIVNQAALFLQSKGATEMALKDAEGELHPGVSLADAITVAEEMAGAYLALWNNRETKKALIRAATTVEAVSQVTW